MFVNDSRVLSKRDSMWWRDLVLINDCSGSSGLSVSDLVNCRVKIGAKSAFWFNNWLGDQTLVEAFSELYARASRPFMSVVEAGHWENKDWRWDVESWFCYKGEDGEGAM